LSGGECVAYIDGASGGNPGPSSYGYLIKRGSEVVTGSGYLGPGTNNSAEYLALIFCLRRALEMGCTSITVNSDSLLLVKQLSGDYRVKHPLLVRLWGEVVGLAAKFHSFRVRHVPREMNLEANRLAREALVRALRRRGGEVDA